MRHPLTALVITTPMSSMALRFSRGSKGWEKIVPATALGHNLENMICELSIIPIYQKSFYIQALLSILIYTCIVCIIFIS